MGTPQERAKGLLGLVRQHADASEDQRHLMGEVAQAFAQEGLFRIAAPVDFFGSEQDPITQIETIETVAYADGSAAWNLMIGIETFGLIAPGFEHCRELIEDLSVVMCSSTASAGRADKVNGGYQVPVGGAFAAVAIIATCLGLLSLFMKTAFATVRGTNIS